MVCRGLLVGAGETRAKAETTALQGGRAKDALCAVADGDTPLFDDATETIGMVRRIICAADFL